MAAMMMCRAHGPVEGEFCAVAGCFEPLQPYTQECAPPADQCSAAGCGMPLPCPLHPVGAADAGHREVAAHLAAVAAQAVPVRAEAARLGFPWGQVAIPSGGLTVGRDFGSACGCQIESYDNVSRSHARLYVEQNRLMVVDLDSTNGTTVNGSRIPPHQPTEVVAGDVLGYGNRLSTTVISGGESR